MITNLPEKQKIVVRAVLKNKNGDILLGKRAQSKNFPGLWEYPGGKLDLGETLEDSLAREVKEETNLSITNISICGMENCTNSDYGSQYLVVYMSADIVDLMEFEHKEPSKTELWDWFDENEFPPMMSKVQYKLEQL